MPKHGRILIVEDEAHMVQTFQALLEDVYKIRVEREGAKGLDAARRYDFDAVLLDINLPDLNGLEVLDGIRKIAGRPQVVVVTGRQDVRTAVQAMKKGAYDYLQKPFDPEELKVTVERALEKTRLEREVSRLRSEADAPYHLENLVGRSSGMKEVSELVRKSAAVDSNVLILGETGTGKELVARAIHVNGARARAPFVPFNCARHTESLIESELFGHEAGAFTGAERRHRGCFEQANGGTLFLDEVGLMPEHVQGRFLRVLEDRRIDRVGGEEAMEVDVRIIAATNEDLQKLVQEKRLREDLYFRLRVIQIHLPPLRERKEDIEPLAEHFLRRSCEKLGRPQKEISKEGMAALKEYDWPGNVRELENLIEMLVALVEEPVIPPDPIVKELYSRLVTKPSDLAGLRDAEGSFENALVRYERRLLLEALQRNNWNKSKTAQELGWHRNTIDYKMKKLGISKTKSS